MTPRYPHVTHDSLKNYYCALFMVTTNASLTQNMQEDLNSNLFYGHVKFSFRILYHKHRTTPLLTISSLILFKP